MSVPSYRPPGSYDDRHRQLQRDLATKQARRRQARSESERSALTGLALFGIVGWSVVTPMLLGLALGIWLDSRWPASWSWTLMLLLLGLSLGCLNAWFWIEREQKR
jgi:ATP synthase protein I